MNIHRWGPALLLALAMILVSLGLSYARSEGMISNEAAKRGVQVMIGLVLAAYANLMPKELAPATLPRSVAGRVQKARRIGGWALTLAGLTQSGLWALAPIDVANALSIAGILAALAIIIGYTLWAYAGYRRECRGDKAIAAISHPGGSVEGGSGDA